MCHNYTLLPNAVYEGISSRPATTGRNSYSLVMNERVDEAHVEPGYIYFSIHGTSGYVIEFVYTWLDIVSLPTDTVISSEQAKESALYALEDPSMGTALSAELKLRQLEFDPNRTDFELRLIYDVRIAVIEMYEYWIDAQSGEILGSAVFYGSSNALFFSPYVRRGLVFTLALLISGVGFAVVKRRIIEAKKLAD